MNVFKSSADIVRLNNSNDWVDKLKIAGACVNETLKTISDIVKNNNVTTQDLETTFLEIAQKHNCKPTFLGYKGFPGALCISVNNELVHGIPGSYLIKDGDVVKIDVGATFDGAIADSAITVICKDAKNKSHIELASLCRDALVAGIKAIQIGKQVGCIGYSINKKVQSSRFGLVTNYGGHAIQPNTPHASPFIANKAQYNEGIRIQPGMTLCIEPMLTLDRDTKTIVKSDGWTVLTKSVAVHEEATVFVGEDEILTISSPL